MFTLDNFFGAWELLLRHIESGALHPTSEVSTAALSSFHELLKDNVSVSFLQASRYNVNFVEKVYSVSDLAPFDAFID